MLVSGVGLVPEIVLEFAIVAFTEKLEELQCLLHDLLVKFPDGELLHGGQSFDLVSDNFFKFLAIELFFAIILSSIF